MNRKVLQYPDPQLTTRSEIVPKSEIVSAKTTEIIADMFQTMMREGGIGLAAPQIGEMSRIIVVNTLNQENGIIETMINPVIERRDGETDSIEGCLSFRTYKEHSYVIKRATTIWVSYFDQQGKYHDNRCLKGINAICVQHEVNHLDGVTMEQAGTPVKSEEDLKV